ncbi:glycerol-3-phosphate acyltransferase [Maritimibacter alkaliphilus HTCC2654]|uniref:Glycerol-3-phosphate acyltransferase n=1 Tax=Maritimibacter alkaliphilus HTCC2654 TaxID=314271 RepID=A3VE64_9RHOB|nr:1-acyl-sn-glycerol-3-phosphate acyltransferase [Maritimibacter alkaliphilus]EAQ13202.1 acyltransferase family protein [Rhodobacterales bacterium HTCC2654] [Maritimibacter alkaliphilus HTCC2654]TYP85374.1 glycerol-3-phosphate acyltransferase [Maritimibacter alkaliphilus HTCC2654]
MNRTVELPLWALILILAFAAVTFASHFLFPSVRWFFRRRMERAVARLNQRLTRPIEPFKIARRYDMIQRLIYDPEVSKAIQQHARDEGVPEQVGFELARRYAREIVPRFSAFLYFGFAIRLSRFISRAFYRVRIDQLDAEVIESIPQDATAVFVMNHRSNMDYVLVTWLAGKRSHLSYAVGEWARVWPLGPLIRAMGAYFIRRKSRNALYRKVLAQYIRMSTESGTTQGMFPEGGLSLTGAVGEPKLGLISYILEGFEPGQSRDVVFVPVAINYDRVMEDRVLLAAGQTGVRKFRLRAFDVVRHVVAHLFLRFTGRFRRFGYASVSVGEPLSLSEFLHDHPMLGERTTMQLARRIMARIRAVVPVLPVPVVAAVFTQEDGLTRAEVAERFNRMVRDMRERGAQIHMPRALDIDPVEQGVELLLVRRVLVEEGGRLTVNPDERAVVEYYAHSIAHLSPGLAQTDEFDAT